MARGAGADGTLAGGDRAGIRTVGDDADCDDPATDRAADRPHACHAESSRARTADPHACHPTAFRSVCSVRYATHTQADPETTAAAATATHANASTDRWSDE
jgi:hypothetical protein